MSFEEEVFTFYLSRSTEVLAATCSKSVKVKILIKQPLASASVLLKY